MCPNANEIAPRMKPLIPIESEKSPKAPDACPAAIVKLVNSKSPQAEKMASERTGKDFLKKKIRNGL
jgi:hypothetical protein